MPILITIPAAELYNDETEEFINLKEHKLLLEHSLLSLYKWESKWCKPFLGTDARTREETLDYIKCMTITKNVDSDIYDRITDEHIKLINKYIEAPMTATTFHEDKKTSGSREIITAEVIYYWMIALNIPLEFEKRHLNHLLTLVKVCNIKNQPPKKRSRKEIMKRNAELNALRRQQFNSNG